MDPYFGVDRRYDKMLAKADARVDWLEKREEQLLEDWRRELSEEREVDYLGESLAQIFLEAWRAGETIGAVLRREAPGAAEWEIDNRDRGVSASIYTNPWPDAEPDHEHDWE